MEESGSSPSPQLSLLPSVKGCLALRGMGWGTRADSFQITFSGFSNQKKREDSPAAVWNSGGRLPHHPQRGGAVTRKRDALQTKTADAATGREPI